MQPATRFLRPLLTIALLLAAAGCSKSISDRDLVLVDPSQALELSAGTKGVLGLGSKGPAVLVDSRPKRNFDEGHIEGAVHMAFPTLADDHKALEQYDVIVVYGATWNDPVAIAMSKRLMEFGHGDVRTLRGGYDAWVDSGNPVVTADPGE